MKTWLQNKAMRAVASVQSAMRSEKGDTNFISILVVLGIVLVVATVFIGFKDQIVEMVQGIVDGFAIES